MESRTVDTDERQGCSRACKRLRHRIPQASNRERSWHREEDAMPILQSDRLVAPFLERQDDYRAKCHCSNA